MMPGGVRRLERASAEAPQEARREIAGTKLRHKTGLRIVLQVNGLTEPEERSRSFAAGFDNTVDDYLTSREEGGGGND